MKLISIAALLVSFSSLASPLLGPRFSDFPAKIYSGPIAPVRIVSHDDRLFRTMIRDAARQKPKFGGHYILTSWGGGSPCIQTVAIDAVTGRTTWLPFTLCCWPVDVDDPRSFRSDSRLLTLQGQRNEAGGQGPWHYVLDRAASGLCAELSKSYPPKHVLSSEWLLPAGSLHRRVG